LRFSALAEHFTRFRVDYLSPSGAIKFYYPDFVAVQKGKNGKKINWIIETKGQVYEAVAYKEASILDWCKKVSAQTGETWNYIRVDQKVFGDGKFKKFSDLVDLISMKTEAPLIRA
jgi:type III restriction enzyme